MPRQYQPYPGYYPRDADDMRERAEPEKKSSWKTYAKYAVYGVIAIVVILLILSATGNLKGSDDNTVQFGNNTNITAQPNEYEQLTAYIVAQQQQGMNKDEIVQRLVLAGFEAEEIEIAFQLADPLTQEIIRLEKEGRTRQEIVDNLLAKQIPPEEIQARFVLLDSIREKTFTDTIKDNWFWLILGAVVIYYVYKARKDALEEQKLTPKVYTLDECEEYAREYLDTKEKKHNPSKQYRNRPDIRQYRFIYEEPLYAEFNDHQPTGHKAGKRMYYLIAIGYDKEVIDYHETSNDSHIDPFLYGAPKGFEQAGSREYMGLRARSEQPVEETRPGEQRPSEFGDIRQPYRPSPYRRRTYPQIRPGPVEGYESP